MKSVGKANASRKRKQDKEDEESPSEGPSVHDDSLLSVTPPSAKKQKKGPAPKKSAGKPLQEIENEAMAPNSPSAVKATKGSKATDQYQKVGSFVLDLD